jgi:hypothetical protein
MKRFLEIIALVIIMSGYAYAAKFSAKVGDTVENQVSFGKDKFPLPPGKFTVAAYKKWHEFRDVYLIQIDEITGIVRWKIKLTATGNQNEKYSSWVAGPMCDQRNLYFLKTKKGSQRFACWSVSHSDGDGEEITRLAISNNFFSFNDRVTLKLGPYQGINELIREFDSSNNLTLPEMFVVSKHQYANKARLYESVYYYNPELDGIPEPENLEWERNEFHKQRIKNFPDHEAFLNKFISVSASLIDRFNQMNRVGGGMTLDASNFAVQASMNAQTSGAKNETSKESIVDQIKQLKELLDAGVLTKEEFQKAKKQILN